MARRVKRRDFLKRAVAGVVDASLGVNRASLFGRNLPASQPSPNDRIVVGFVGMGRMGQSNLKTFMKHPDVEVAAVCDVYSTNLDVARKITDGRAKALKDFRRL